MIICEDVASLKKLLKDYRNNHKSIGFVPTMGALHAGHLALIKQAKTENDIVVCSIYVNPTQFNNANDFTFYPRTEKEDALLLEGIACDVLFLPSKEEMYPYPVHTKFSFGQLEEVMEGKQRPGHFNGVALIVSKLFHLVAPDHVYFGQKDLQQCAVIKQLIRDLFFDMQMNICATLREEDGLAMSSRNKRLNTEERAIAPKLFEALCLAKTLLLENKTPIAEVKQKTNHFFEKIPAFKLDYFEIVETDTLMPINTIDLTKPTSLCIAAYVGEVRLIDNISLFL